VLTVVGNLIDNAIDAAAQAPEPRWVELTIVAVEHDLLAMQGGALHYLLKPFSFPALRDKLLSYAQMRSRLDALHEPGQRNVDPVFGALRAPDQLAGAKGRSPHTLEAVERLLVSGGQEMSATEVAEVTGMSRATAQRYLSHLAEIGRVEIRLRYGSGGRPEHGYRWSSTGQP
jgi:response regulator of citrate/malate metabolism